MIKNFFVCIAVACGLLGCAHSAISAELRSPDSQDLVHALNNIEVVEDRREIPLRIRIFRLRDLGECDGEQVQCPEETLMIAVSSYDEAPDQNLFVLPKSLGWKFEGWIKWPTTDDASQFAEFVGSMQTDSANGGNDAQTNKYLIRVNAYQGSIAPL